MSFLSKFRRGLDQLLLGIFMQSLEFLVIMMVKNNEFHSFLQRSFIIVNSVMLGCNY